MSKKISVIIVTFNSIRYLPSVFEALKKQTLYQDLEVIVVDNNSDSETKKFLREENIILIENSDNAGFTKANNQGIAQASGDYILCLNHDVVLEPDYIEQCVAFFEKTEKAGAVSGYIKKWDFAKDVFTEKVDTLGFKIFKNHKVIDSDSLNFEEQGFAEVFGVSAAVAMYRKTLVDRLISISGHFFDESFGSYKEDVDVAYRMLHAGYASYVLRDAVAYHDRWETGSSQRSFAEEREARKKKPAFINKMSYQNHLTVLLKNEFFINYVKNFFAIEFFELKKCVYYLIFEPRTIIGLFGFLKSLSLTLKKRHDIFKSSVISSTEIAKWFE